MRKPAFVVTVLVVALCLVLPSGLFACYVCKYSPNYWGFCHAGATRGYGDCAGYVADPWTGRTDCSVGAPNCYNGGTILSEEDDVPYGPDYRYAEKSPCSWTDTETILLV